MKKFARISILLSLLLCVACSTVRERQPPPQTVTKVVVVEPPKALLGKCELPREALVETAVNGDLVDAYVNWKEAAKQCAAKFIRLNQWFEAGSSRNGDKEGKTK